ncbi:MAG TPA: DUF4129 domain-containing protein [Candidatus Kapabacteria bacterium]|jgi:hypothetical protein|nr:DUF4129 domain-containing protein [Candidatus Kapabacteria bacterium]HRI30297.1 DUF4129 domain-containing protein [Candidatus Kapabacteria bacterium]HRK59614.1 DUF4129 domain-containing protein [Candidatus Kapabacteria bacterium]
MQYPVFIVLLVLFSLCSKADEIMTDSSQIRTAIVLTSTKSRSGIALDSATTKIVRLDNGVLDSYRQSTDYDYGFDPPPTSSFGESIRRWISMKLSEFFTNIVPYYVWEIIVYVIAIGSIIALVASIMKTGLFSLVTGKKSQHLSFSEIAEDIHGMDFPSLIAQSILSGEYRYSVRLHYLHILKILTDAELIIWKPEKTNKEYFKDLAPTALSEPFIVISRIFEYVWYGERRITEKEYKEIEQQFENCKQLVRKKA